MRSPNVIISEEMRKKKYIKPEIRVRHIVKEKVGKMDDNTR